MSLTRKSVVLDKLRQGEAVFCYKSNLSCCRTVQIAALSGFDCIWLCNEHVPNDYGDMERQILAVLAHGADVMVRVPRGAYSDTIKPLELNASGILVPHVMSAAEARQIVRTTRFHPLGRRPADGGNADGAFCLLPFKTYIEFMNANRFVMIQIEDVEAVAELDAICAVEGIDAIFFGPGDYSQSIGCPGEIDHPEVQRVRKLVAATALKHGKFAATVGSITNAAERLAEGYRFINLGSDVRDVGLACTEKIKVVRELALNG